MIGLEIELRVNDVENEIRKFWELQTDARAKLMK